MRLLPDGTRSAGNEPRVLVIETSPDMAPGLRYEFGDQILVTAVSRASEAEGFFERYPASLLVWNISSDSSAVFGWLTRCLLRDAVPPTIVCRCRDFCELEQPLRMLGVISLRPESGTYQELAALCRRILAQPVKRGWET